MMKIISFVKRLRYLLLLVPLTLVFVGISHRDSFYFILATILFIISVIFLFPRFLAWVHIGIPYGKKASIATIQGQKKIDKKRPKERFSIQKPNKKTLFYFTIATVLSTIVYSLALLFKFERVSESVNFALGSYIAYGKFVADTIMLHGVFLAVVFLVVITVVRSTTKKMSPLAILIRSFFFIILMLVLSFHFALAIGMAVGSAQLRLLAMKINSGSAAVTFLSSPTDIAVKLRERNTLPRILGTSDDVERVVLFDEVERNSRFGSFYLNSMLRTLPQFLYPKVNLPQSSLLFTEDVLFVFEINKDDIETITPALGKLLVKGKFDPRYIKDEPTIEVLGRQEYLKYREEKINEQVDEFEGYISEVRKAINLAYAGINEAKQMISENENGKSNSITARNEAYDYCMNAGYYSYYFGIFYRYYSDQYCNDERARWDNIIQGYEQNIADWQSSLSYYQSQLPGLQEVLEQLELVKSIIEARKETTPLELGVFEPPNTIKIALDSTSDEAMRDYLATVVHEYLHYTSYVSEERSLPLFFEEGLTEYFSRQTLYAATGIDSNLGYPLIIPIIDKMSEKIPEEELLDIYFTKDETGLLAVLGQSYGQNFYDDSKYYFFALSFGGGGDMLKIANNVMFKIGGDEIRVEEVLSN